MEQTQRSITEILEINMEQTMKYGLQSKLASWAAIMLLMLAVIPTTIGCTKISVAQDIVNWTPTIISAATTVATVVSSLAPADSLIIAAAVTGFDAGANLVATQAQSYLDNPTTSVLLTLQNQVLTFQQSVNTSLLQAAKITNAESQQKVLSAIQGLSTGVTAVLALISTIKGNTLSAASLTAPVKIAQLATPDQINVSTNIVADHYHITSGMAEMAVRTSIQGLRKLGL